MSLKLNYSGIDSSIGMLNKAKKEIEEAAKTVNVPKGFKNAEKVKKLPSEISSIAEDSQETITGIKQSVSDISNAESSNEDLIAWLMYGTPMDMDIDSDDGGSNLEKINDILEGQDESTETVEHDSGPTDVATLEEVDGNLDSETHKLAETQETPKGSPFDTVEAKWGFPEGLEGMINQTTDETKPKFGFDAMVSLGNVTAGLIYGKNHDHVIVLQQGGDLGNPDSFCYTGVQQYKYRKGKPNEDSRIFSTMVTIKKNGNKIVSIKKEINDKQPEYDTIVLGYKYSDPKVTPYYEDQSNIDNTVKLLGNYISSGAVIEDVSYSSGGYIGLPTALATVTEVKKQGQNTNNVWYHPVDAFKNLTDGDTNTAIMQCHVFLNEGGNILAEFSHGLEKGNGNEKAIFGEICAVNNKFNVSYLHYGKECEEEGKIATVDIEIKTDRKTGGNIIKKVRQSTAELKQGGNFIVGINDGGFGTVDETHSTVLTYKAYDMAHDNNLVEYFIKQQK